MASIVVSPSSKILDSSGTPHERSALTMELDRLDLLLQTSSQVQRKLKGKNISDSVLVSLTASVVLPVAPADVSNSRVPPLVDLGVSSNLEPFASTTDPVLPPHEAASIPKSWATIAKRPAHPLQFVPPIYEADSSVICRYPLRSLQSHIGGIPLFLRKWEADIKPIDFFTSVFPVWVHLSHVPLELLTKEGLSYLASAIGTPLHMNQEYSKLLVSDRVSLCVDVDFSKPLL
ncbi:hypothetical protein Tsubulata_014501 [Turnera subulata]|uniref:DUF4283 domain-containing protein n=1 Tax=Turnera subulata TaxID=218843 RepID=A0A9Q0G3D9_9ROSI|nr:hypothetical protein Tsubulata_014501 [Turnera subulata]